MFLWKPVSGDRRGPSVVLWNQGDECICGVFKTGEVPVLERRDGKLFSALEAERPENMQEVVEIAMRLELYEFLPEKL